MTCAYPGCSDPTSNPGDMRYRYCKPHGGRRHGQSREVRICAFPDCDNPFKPTGRGRFKYCTDHRGKRGSGYRQVPEWRRKVPAGRVGAVHVDQVRVDLAMRGYDVWRAVDNHCPCDLIAGRGPGIFRVEVTTGHWTASGKPHINHPKRSMARYSSEKWDVLAIVTETGIVYEPDILSFGEMYDDFKTELAAINE